MGYADAAISVTCFFLRAFFAASSITAATFAGSSSMTIMQVGRIIATAPILFAADSSIAAAAFRALLALSAKAEINSKLVARRWLHPPEEWRSYFESATS